MTDPRLGPFIAAYVAIVLYAVWAKFVWTLTDATERPPAQVAAVLILWLPGLFLAAWADQVLWNMVAPIFGWPLIDLFSALIIGTLVSTLIWSTAGVRRVRIEK